MMIGRRWKWTLWLLLIITFVMMASSIYAQSHRGQNFPPAKPSKEVKRGAKYGAIAFIALAVIYALARLASSPRRTLTPAQARPHSAPLAFDPLEQPNPLATAAGGEGDGVGASGAGSASETSGSNGTDSTKEGVTGHGSDSGSGSGSPLADFIPEQYENVKEEASLAENTDYVRFSATDVELRLLKSELSRDLPAKSAFIKKSRKLIELNHKSLLDFRSVETDIWPFLVTAPINGVSLEEKKPAETDLACHIVLKVIAHLSRLLEYLHANKQHAGTLTQSTVFVNDEWEPTLVHLEPTLQEDEIENVQKEDLLALARLLEVLTESHSRPPKVEELLTKLRQDGGDLRLPLSAFAAECEQLAADLPCTEGWKLEAIELSEDEQSSEDEADETDEADEPKETTATDEADENKD